jgi:hypothetical protein
MIRLHSPDRPWWLRFRGLLPRARSLRPYHIKSPEETAVLRNTLVRGIRRRLRLSRTAPLLNPLKDP